ncbi:hypothetical protein L873DRAFT_493994 [Choiromyces venosus 120613-1]|uniref:Uncharacterized protein n=1 Tax=Choiromyces venosus 120613-1 TaxID=1336337 RepID=A0A3N4JZ74_9PEZI|nr:hypothetical protein L873DRAFT_493994 [Choiromyces venosus 120613-1]
MLEKYQYIRPVPLICYWCTGTLLLCTHILFPALPLYFLYLSASHPLPLRPLNLQYHHH